MKKTIYINHLDVSPNKYLTKILANTVLSKKDEEEGDDDTAPKEEIAVTTSGKQSNAYNIVGTIQDPKYEKPEYIKEIIPKTLIGEERKQRLFSCDVFIFNIRSDEDENDLTNTLQTAELLYEDSLDPFGLKPNYPQKIFILISSFLTWANTPKSSEDGDLSEHDARFRKCIPTYYSHYRLERSIETFGKANRSKFATCIVTPGIFYGYGENIFHYLFKHGFQSMSSLPLIGRGKNILPTIHIEDFAKAIINLIEKHPKISHLVVVDDSKNTLKQITRAVSSAFSTGHYHHVWKDAALKLPDMKLTSYNLLNINLSVVSVFLKETLNVELKYKTGLIDNLSAVIEEFITFRGLHPYKVLILGPPGSGRKALAARLVEHYKFHHINSYNVIHGKMHEMKTFIAEHEERKAMRKAVHTAKENAMRLKLAAALRQHQQQEEEMQDEEEYQFEQEEEGAVAGEEVFFEEDWDAVDEEMEEHDNEKVAEYSELLTQMEETLENDRLDETQVMGLIRDALLSKPVASKGFILEGYPKTKQQAEALYSGSEVGEGEISEESIETKNYSAIIPRLVILLRADDDDFLISRAQQPDERTVIQNGDEEHTFMKRLSFYRKHNTIEKAVIDYFDEKQLHVVEIDITKDTSPEFSDTFNQIIHLIGPQKRYELSAESESLEATLALEAIEKRSEIEKNRRDYLEAEEAYTRSKKQKEWNERLTEVENEERKMLVAKSTPLRHYLMRFVMPTLTEAMVTCCKTKPEDPVDFIAEYLINHNPQDD